MIIVEGCDNTGKTTLIQKLKERFPQLEVVPKWTGPRGPGSMKKMWDHMMTYLTRNPDETKYLVFDRFPLISELVYGPVIRKHIEFSREQIEQATELLKKHFPLVIYCRRDPEAILANFEEREQMEGVRENVKALIDQYNRVLCELDFLGIPVVDYTFDVSDTWTNVIFIMSIYLEEA